MFAIDEFRMFRLDRRRRVGGGLCVMLAMLMKVVCISSIAPVNHAYLLASN